MPGHRRWRFEERSSGRSTVWTWEEIRPDGSTSHSARPHRAYARAVLDAIRHGFRPNREPWDVVTHGQVTSFSPAGGRRARKAL